MNNEHLEHMNTAQLIMFIIGNSNVVSVERHGDHYNVVAITDTGSEGALGGDVHGATLALARRVRDKYEAEKLRADLETLDGAVKYINEKTDKYVQVVGYDDFPFEIAFRAQVDGYPKYLERTFSDGITAEAAIIKLAKKIMEETK